MTAIIPARRKPKLAGHRPCAEFRAPTRRHGSTRLLLAETIAHHSLQQHLAQDPTDVLTHQWTISIDHLATARTRSLSATARHTREDLLAAVTYSDTITLAAALLSPTGSTPRTANEPALSRDSWDHSI
jgi:hypothetical protein